MGAHDRFRRNAEVVDRDIDGERLLIPLRHDASQPVELMVLNRVAGVIWDALAGPAEVPEVIAQVMARFDVTRETAERDTRSFLELLVQRGLAERA